MNNQPTLQKVTKSLYIVTHLGQLPFMLITQMARTWALKEDSVNMSIIHWYSTVMATDSGLENLALIPNVEDKAVNAEARATLYVRKTCV